MSKFKLNRREFLKSAGVVTAASCLPMSMVELAFADPRKNFTFAYISDSHLQHIAGTKFVNNWDRGLIRAVAETNLLTPKPDFVVFGGDLAQLGKKEELDHGAEMLAKLNYKTYHVMGEHDYYLDLGEYWSKLYGDQYYTKGRTSSSSTASSPTTTGPTTAGRAPSSAWWKWRVWTIPTVRPSWWETSSVSGCGKISPR